MILTYQLITFRLLYHHRLGYSKSH